MSSDWQSNHSFFATYQCGRICVLYSSHWAMKNANCNDVCNAMNQNVPPSMAYDAEFATKNCTQRQSKPWSNNCPNCVGIAYNVSYHQSLKNNGISGSDARSFHSLDCSSPSSWPVCRPCNLVYSKL